MNHSNSEDMLHAHRRALQDIGTRQAHRAFLTSGPVRFETSRRVGRTGQLVVKVPTARERSIRGAIVTAILVVMFLFVWVSAFLLTDPLREQLQVERAAPSAPAASTPTPRLGWSPGATPPSMSSTRPVRGVH